MLGSGDTIAEQGCHQQNSRSIDSVLRYSRAHGGGVFRPPPSRFASSSLLTPESRAYPLAILSSLENQKFSFSHSLALPSALASYTNARGRIFLRTSHLPIETLIRIHGRGKNLPLVEGYASNGVGTCCISLFEISSLLTLSHSMPLQDPLSSSSSHPSTSVLVQQLFFTYFSSYIYRPRIVVARATFLHEPFHAESTQKLILSDPHTNVISKTLFTITLRANSIF